MSPSKEIAESRAMILLAGAEASDEQQRSGWATITDIALNLTGQPEEDTEGWEEAKELSRIPLEALGAIPYEVAMPRTMWGAPQKPGSSE